MSFPFLDTVSFQTPIFLFLYSFNLFWLLTFDFTLFSPFLDMHSLHRTWGDGLIARGHCSCFVFFGFFIFFFFSFALHFDFSICSFPFFFLLACINLEHSSSFFSWDYEA
jgi:hypothetical protein